MSTSRRRLAGFRLHGRIAPPAQHRLQVIEGLTECRCCGYFQRVPELAPGRIAECIRCNARLGRRRTNPAISTPLAFCIASAVLYMVAITLPLMTLDLYGRLHDVGLLTGPQEFWREGWQIPAVLVALATAVMPPVVIGLMLAVLWAGSRPVLPRWAPRLLRYYERLRPWSMVEVYMLGIFVAYTKLIDLAHVTLGPAVFALAGLMLMQAATDSTLDIELIWRKRPVSRFVRRASDNKRCAVSSVDASEIEIPPAHQMVGCPNCGLVMTAHRDLPAERPLGRCPRCAILLRRRKPQALLRCMALVASAVVLYVPANLFPVMTIIKVGRGGGHTIMNGVIELYRAHMLPLALLVFFASITVPVLKILSLTLMSVAAWRGSAWRLVDRSRLFRIVDFIGRWSMIDVFMISILAALVHFGGLANVTADPGMFAFAAVVVITIFAADSFDPRVMWDTAGLNGPVRAHRRRARMGATLETESAGA